MPKAIHKPEEMKEICRRDLRVATAQARDWDFDTLITGPEGIGKTTGLMKALANEAMFDNQEAGRLLKFGCIACELMIKPRRRPPTITTRKSIESIRGLR